MFVSNYFGDRKNVTGILWLFEKIALVTIK